MELKTLSDKGATGTFDAPDALFARDFNEALVHQVVVAFQANARIGSRAQKDRRGQPLDQEAVAAEGYRSRPRRHDFQPAVARRRQDLPQLAG